MTVCLCCGERYEYVCPNMINVDHSMHRAAEVAQILLDWGINHPEPQDVRRAIMFLALDGAS